MSIRGDLQAMMVSRHGGKMEDYDQTVSDILDWLSSADVIVFLRDTGSDMADYLSMIDALRDKCVKPVSKE